MEPKPKTQRNTPGTKYLRFKQRPDRDDVYLVVEDARNGYYGSISRVFGKYYFGPTGNINFIIHATAGDLRQIAEKLDELNGKKKRKARPMNISGPFYIRVRKRGKIREFGGFLTSGHVAKYLDLNGWQQRPGKGDWVLARRDGTVYSWAAICVIESGPIQLEHPEKLPSKK